MKSKYINYGMHYAAIILVIMAAMQIISCSTPADTAVTSVPVEYHDRIEYITRIDSVYVHDSVITKSVQRNDTVFYYKERVKDRYVYTAHIDTFIVRDTIPAPYPVTVTQEVNILKHWQQLLMTVGGVAIFAFLILIIAFFKRRHLL